MIFGIEFALVNNVALFFAVGWNRNKEENFSGPQLTSACSGCCNNYRMSISRAGVTQFRKKSASLDDFLSIGK
jgi:hypothetical protein